MKSTTTAVAILGLVGSCAAQAAPSPTESVGCVAHGDHWHCAGPAITSAEAVVTSAPAAVIETAAATGEDHEHGDYHDEDHEHGHEHGDDNYHEHDHEPGEAAAAPSPTESIGCIQHGDYWHCSGPRTTTDSGTAEATSEVDGDEDAKDADGDDESAAPTRFGAGIMLPLIGLFVLIFAA